jgi:hypothetical protein
MTTPEDDKDTEEARVARERKALEAKLAANPRFRLLPPTGTGIVIVGARPPR